jgi:hypothetical protein
VSRATRRGNVVIRIIRIIRIIRVGVRRIRESVNRWLIGIIREFQIHELLDANFRRRDIDKVIANRGVLLHPETGESSVSIELQETVQVVLE